MGRDKDPKMAAKVQESHCRDPARANNPANSGLFAENQEISVRARMRGGAGRTRTYKQEIMSLPFRRRFKRCFFLSNRLIRTTRPRQRWLDPSIKLPMRPVKP